MSLGSTSFVRTVLMSGVMLFGVTAYGQSIAFQGFEDNTIDWTGITTRVPSGGGSLHLTPASGSFYAELTNVHDSYQTGYGGAEYSFFSFTSSVLYPGYFSQSISLYVNANWPTALYNGPGIWIDMTPTHPDSNFGAEHNFRLTPTGNSVLVTVDGQTSPIATITTSGWYKFQMTYRQSANPSDLISTDMKVFNATPTLVGYTTVVSNSPGGPALSSDLGGPGYVWLTVWPNGWANDVLAIDDVRADLFSKSDCFNNGWQNFPSAPGPFSSQNQCVSYFTTGGATAQSINFGALAKQKLSASPITLSATASSGLTVSFTSLTPDVCTVSGTTVTLVTGGLCSIEATQAGNGTYSAAVPIIRNFSVTQTNQVITFDPIKKQTLNTPPFLLEATSTSGLTVSFASNTPSVCTVSGATLTLVSAGQCSVTASQAGDATYGPAKPVTRTFQVVKASQTITFPKPPNQNFGAPPFQISATASSGLTVSFASLTPSVCTVSGTTVTLVAPGQCVIQATQNGDATYDAANPVSRSFLVN